MKTYFEILSNRFRNTYYFYFSKFRNTKLGACNGSDGGQVNPRMKQYIMDYSCPLIETDVQISLQYHHLLKDLCIQAA